MKPIRVISAIDVHAAGEPGRILIGSHLMVKGRTMAERLAFCKENLDCLRRLVLREPRGYPGMCAVLVTSPCVPGADFGMIVLEQDGFRAMSGSNTICAVTALLETGLLPTKGPTTSVTIDTAVGLVEASATMEDGKVTLVEVLNVPAFVEVLDYPLEVPELGIIPVDVVFGGQYFVQAKAVDAGVDLTPPSAKRIARAGALIRLAAREQIMVKHPENPEINSIDLVMLHGPSTTPGVSGRNVVVCCNGEVTLDRPDSWTGALDRSPCGTGTSARMAALHARGELGYGERFVHEGILGTTFTGELRGPVPEHVRGAVWPTVAGTGWITAISQLILDASDPFPNGYTLADIWTG